MRMERSSLRSASRPPSLVRSAFLSAFLVWLDEQSVCALDCANRWVRILHRGSFLLFNSVLNYLGDAYPDYTASAFAGNDFISSSFGAGFPLSRVQCKLCLSLSKSIISKDSLLTQIRYRKLGVDWATSLLGFLSISFIPILFVLYFYGQRIWKASKRARHDL